MNEVINTIAHISIGAIIIWGIVIRYRTLNTGSFVTNSKVSMFIFSSFAAGLLLVNFNEASYIFHNIIWLNSPSRILAILTPSFFPFFLRITQGYYIKSAWRWSWWYLMFTLIMLSILSTLHDQNVLPELFVIVYFMSLSISMGMIHSLFGPVLSAFNISIMLSALLSGNIIPISVNNIFDIIALSGIHSQTMQWIILLTSTILGLHGTLDSYWLKSKCELMKEKLNL